MKFRHLLLILLSLALFANFSCDEEFKDPEANEDDIYYSDPTVDTDIIFTFNGTTYLTEDFVIQGPHIRYNNREWLFDTRQQQRIYKEVNGTRELAGGVFVSVAKKVNYSGGDKDTFRGSYSIGDEGIYLSIRLYLFEAGGYNNIGGLYLPEYSTDGIGLLYLNGSEIVQRPWNYYQSYSGSITFNKISSRQIKAVFEGDMTDRNNVGSGGTIRGTIDYRNDNDQIFSDSRFVPASGEDDDNSSGIACQNLDYNGPQEGQVKQWCQYAQFLACLGLNEEKEVQCTILEDYGATCPYCN